MNEVVPVGGVVDVALRGYRAAIVNDGLPATVGLIETLPAGGGDGATARDRSRCTVHHDDERKDTGVGCSVGPPMAALTATATPEVRDDSRSDSIA